MHANSHMSFIGRIFHENFGTLNILMHELSEKLGNIFPRAKFLMPELFHLATYFVRYLTSLRQYISQGFFHSMNRYVLSLCRQYDLTSEDSRSTIPDLLRKCKRNILPPSFLTIRKAFPFSLIVYLWFQMDHGLAAEASITTNGFSLR